MRKLEQWDLILGVQLLPLTKSPQDFIGNIIVKDVAEFIRSCDECQKQLVIKKDTANELRCIPVPSEVMKQVGIDICTLPEVDGFIYLVVLIDYFSKWSEAKPLKNKQLRASLSFYTRWIAAMVGESYIWFYYKVNWNLYLPLVASSQTAFFGFHWLSGESLFTEGSHYLPVNHDWGSHYLPENNDRGVVIYR